MKYKNVLFDLDGTLLDTSEGIKEAVSYTIKEMGYRKLSNEELSTFIGPPIQVSLVKYFGCTADVSQRGAEIFRSYYKNTSLLKAVPYDGIFKLLKYINENGGNVAIATYKREDYALKLLKAFGFHKYCQVMHGADNFNKLSKSDIIKICLDELGGINSQSLYIGDTNGDLVGANESGIDFVGVTYGFGFCSNKKYSFNTSDNCMGLIKYLED